jgi:hypothetical protein
MARAVPVQISTRVVPAPPVSSGGSDEPAFQPLSVSGGELLLGDATFSDAGTSIVQSVARTYQGIEVVMQNSATAVINSIPDAAVWTWSLGGTMTLPARASVLTLLERMCSVYPSLVTAFCMFTDNGDAKLATGNGWGVEFGWPSTTVRRVGYLARAGAGWSRTVGAGVAGVHFGADCHVRPHTHTDIAQGRAYPRDAAGARSAAPGVNAQGSTAQLEGRMTHFHAGVMWNSTAGGNPTVTFDPGYWISEEALHT